MTRRVCTKQATTNQPLLASLFAFERAQHGLLACHCTMKHTHNRNTREGRQKNQAGSSHGEQHTQYSFNENEKKKEVRRRQDSSTSPSEKKKGPKNQANEIMYRKKGDSQNCQPRVQLLLLLLRSVNANDDGVIALIWLESKLLFGLHLELLHFLDF